MKKIFLSLFILSIFGFGYSQEVITNLSENPSIKNFIKNNKNIKSQKSDAEIVLTLPFFDDFSYDGVYPYSTKWLDNFVFVNNDYPYFPVSIGAATFDALDDEGNLYKDASIYAFKADYLTSLPIRLDSIFSPQHRSLSLKDSIYLSFYYQPQGRGNAPEDEDSLVLEFLSPNEFDTIFGTTDTTIVPKWNRVWSSAGMSLNTFKSLYGTYFHQVIIPIQDSAIYYCKNFQFRFMNYASMADNTIPGWQSNCDFWNVDYVYLNYGRSRGDTVYKDITFVGRAPSMLKKYEAMPYQQYSSNNFVNEMKDTLNIYISNLSNINYNSTYQYKVTQNENLVKNYNGGSFSLDPFYIKNYVDHQPFAKPPVNFLFPIGLQDSIQFDIKHFLTNDTSLRRPENDTITFVQKFTNYFAYDDGTPEAGYGLTPSGAQLAYRFKLNKPDTLRAVRIYFNSLFDESSQLGFYLMIWADDRQQPGDVLYSRVVLTPAERNHFTTYYIDDTTLLLDEQHKTFYVGWKQVTSDNLNVGYDLYNNASENIFYNTDGAWTQSIYSGALMIRPVVGKKLSAYGIPDNKKINNYELVVYPNPSQGNTVQVILPGEFQNTINSNDYKMMVCNLVGSSVYSGYYSSILNINGFAKGIYIIKVENVKTHQVFIGKLIVG